MLLRYFRKIDAFSGLRLFAIALLALLAIWFEAQDAWISLGWSLVLGGAWLYLSWTLMRDRWVVRGTLFRFLIYFITGVYWTSEFYLNTLLFYTLVVELNWHLVEHHKRRGAVLSVLHSGTLTALASLWNPSETIFLASITLIVWLIAGGVRLRTVLQWLLAWGVAQAAVMFSAAGNFELEMKVQGAEVPTMWWLLPIVLMLFAISEWVQSYLKANQTNKSRGIVAGLWIIGGAVLAWTMHSEFAFALMFLGLSYHLTNALRYLKRERLGEALLWLVVIFVLITHFDLILL